MHEHEAPASESDPRESARPRHLARWTGGLVVLVLLVMGVWFVWGVASIRTASKSAQSHLTDAQEAIGDDDIPGARAGVAGAYGDLEAAQGALGSIPFRVLGAVPLVSAPVDDVEHLIDAGESAVQASDALVAAYASVAGSDGASALFHNGSHPHAVHRRQGGEGRPRCGDPVAGRGAGLVPRHIGPERFR